MSRSNRRLPLLLTVVGLLFSAPAIKSSGAAILEPDFTRAPVRDVNSKLCDSISPCKPNQATTFTVDKPFDFTAITNNSEFDITDLHLKIIGTTTVTWGDVDNNGFVGQRGADSSASIFQKTKVSADGKTIDLFNGKIAKGEAFNPLFIVSGLDLVRIQATFTVPEPSTSLMFGAMAAALSFVGWRRSR